MGSRNRSRVLLVPITEMHPYLEIKFTSNTSTLDRRVMVVLEISQVQGARASNLLVYQIVQSKAVTDNNHPLPKIDGHRK